MAIYIAFGANLHKPDSGPIVQTFRKAFDWLDARGVRVVAMSGIWQSPAWPLGSDQPDYENGCAQVQTDLDASALLALLHECETEFGRSRSVKNAARTLDLDLLDYKGQVSEAETIELPHPRMCQRGFVLLPLYEIAPDWHDPIERRAIYDWIARLPLSDIEPMSEVKRPGWYQS